MATKNGLWDVEWPSSMISALNSSPDQEILDPSADKEFTPSLRGVLCNAAATIQYVTYDGRQLTFDFPVGLHAVMIKELKAAGSTFTEGEVLGLY